MSMATLESDVSAELRVRVPLPRSARIAVVHIAERLFVCGCCSVMREYARLSSGARFRPLVLGLSGDESYVEGLAEERIQAAIIGHDLAGLSNAIGGSEFVAVVHRSGERTRLWDSVLPALKRQGARAILERSVFGYPDNGPSASCLDLVMCNSMSTLRRHWLLSGQPAPSDYLTRHRVLYNPMTFAPSPHELAEARVALRSRLGIPADAFVMGDVCRPDPGKLDLMMAGVLPRLLRSVPNAWFIARRYPERAAPQMQRVSRGRFINLPTSNQQTDLIETYAAMDVLVHMSTMGESFGMAIAEAMRSGLPVVANETPADACDNAQCELIVHGHTGILASDPASVYRALLTLAQSPERRQSIGLAGQERFKSARFSPANAIAQLEGEIDGLLTAPSDRRPTPARMPSIAELRDFLVPGRRTYQVAPTPASLRELPWSMRTNLRRKIWRLQRRFR